MNEEEQVKRVAEALKKMIEEIQTNEAYGHLLRGGQEVKINFDEIEGQFRSRWPIVKDLSALRPKGILLEDISRKAAELSGSVLTFDEFGHLGL